MERATLEEFIRNEFRDYSEVGDRHIFSNGKARLSISPSTVITYSRCSDYDGKQTYDEVCIPLDSVVFVRHHTSYTYGANKKESFIFSLKNKEEIQVVLA